MSKFKLNYAPGSVMKPITASIGLESGMLRPDQAVTIQGKKWQKDRSWGNYFVTRVHEANSVNLEKAFVFSDNIYFAQTALTIGKEAFVNGLKKFGFEEDLNYSYPITKSSIGSVDSENALADSGYG